MEPHGYHVCVAQQTLSGCIRIRCVVELLYLVHSRGGTKEQEQTRRFILEEILE